MLLRGSAHADSFPDRKWGREIDLPVGYNCIYCTLQYFWLSYNIIRTFQLFYLIVSHGIYYFYFIVSYLFNFYLVVPIKRLYRRVTVYHFCINPAKIWLLAPQTCKRTGICVAMCLLAWWDVKHCLPVQLCIALWVQHY